MLKRQVTSPMVSAPAGIFSHAIEASPGNGSFLFLSGMTSRSEDGTVFGVGDIRAQTERCLENMRHVLSESNSTLDDLVALTVYVTDMGHFDAIHEVRGRYFSTPYPSSTMVEVTALVLPEMLIEITGVAVARSA